MDLNEREKRLIYLLRKLHFARVTVQVENGLLMAYDVQQKGRLDRPDSSPFIEQPESAT